uniref:Uncharacterized protein n=1 Tax=Anguilla anguilla TaxID=7936 RepID=A0A0E9RUG6_ANGAN
MGAAEGATWSL